MRSRHRIAVLLATTAIVLGACSGGATTAPSTATQPSTAPAASTGSQPSTAAEPVTINWWHITTGDPGKSDVQAAADAYTAAHPNVPI